MMMWHFSIGVANYFIIFSFTRYFTHTHAPSLYNPNNQIESPIEWSLTPFETLTISSPNQWPIPLILLLGVCPNQGCLVKEYMENGSLEDRLLRKNGTPPSLGLSSLGSSLSFCLSSQLKAKRNYPLQSKTSKHFA